MTYDKNGIVTEDADAAYVKEEARINKIPVRQVENLPAEVTYRSTSCCLPVTRRICPMLRN